MTRALGIVSLAVLAAGCGSKAPRMRVEPKAFGAALIEVSGGKQIAEVGAGLDQPLVVQVNDAQGAPVAGALVSFRSEGGANVSPDQGLTGADGQFSATVTLGGVAGHCRILSATRDKSGKTVELVSDEIALGYQANLGRQLNDRYCSRCHDPESTPERVSNHDNLRVAPHAFTDGAFLNKMTGAELTNIITHGGPAMNKSPEMPPYGTTLDKAEIDALVAFIRAVADPPYQVKGMVYAKN